MVFQSISELLDVLQGLSRFQMVFQSCFMDGLEV